MIFVRSSIFELVSLDGILTLSSRTSVAGRLSRLNRLNRLRLLSVSSWFDIMIRSSVCKVILYAHLESNSSVAAGGGVRIIFGSIVTCVRTYVYTYINLAYTITQYYYLYLFNNIMSYDLHIHLNILIHNYQYLRLYLTYLLFLI